MNPEKIVSNTQESEDNEPATLTEKLHESAMLDPDLRAFLIGARASISRRGDGIFISGARGADTTKFRKYGTPVNGALIIQTPDPRSEIDRIPQLVNDLKQNVDPKNRKLIERDRKNKAEEQVLKEQEKGRIIKEEIDKRMLEIQPALKEFERLADEYKDSLDARIIHHSRGKIHLVTKRLDIKIVTTESRDFDFEKKLRDTGYNDVLTYFPKLIYSSPERVRLVEMTLEREKNILPIVKKLLPEINRLNEELAREIGALYKIVQSSLHLVFRIDTHFDTSVGERNDYFMTFHNKRFECSDEGLETLKLEVRTVIDETKQTDSDSMKKLQSMNVHGLTVSRLKINESPELSDTNLKVGEEIIYFGTIKGTNDAYRWAFENGAISPDEQKIREGVEKGETIKVLEKFTPGRGHTDVYIARMFNGVVIGNPDSDLSKLVDRLLKERVGV
ncbi:MAG: hypothetical protein NTZ38_02765 [Candidatus Taylorbacteria bacterium]|nr:hypothetical protein [Candidatus Taylorbacteria bacterium]